MSQSSTGHSIVENTTTFDADVHVSAPIDIITRYLDDPYADKLQSYKNAGYSYRPTSGWDPYLGGKIPSDRSVIDADETYATLCEEFGIDHPVLNVLATLSTIPNSDLAANIMPGLNDMLLDRFLDKRSNFYGLATIAPQVPDKAAEEIDRVADEDQIVGILICSTHANEPLGDPQYDPIYRAVEENDLMVAYHGSAAGAFSTQFPIQNNGFETFMSIHVLTHAWSQMATLTSLIEQGTMVKFPDVNFLFQEAGIGWVPYMMYRLNKEHAIRRSEAPLLEKSPETHIRDSCYFSSQPIGEPDNPMDMQPLFDLVGPESLMFASDYPHWDFDHPSAIDQYLRTNFTEEQREQILNGTPSECFGVDI